MQQFSFDTISDFDKHINGSITGYSLLHSLVIEVSSFFIKANTTPVDLGCTSGELIKQIQEKYGVKSIGYDITDKQFQKGFDLRIQDISDPFFKIPKTDLIYSIFTLQFIETEKRLSILKNIYNSLNKNGCLIICEKEYSLSSFTQEIFTFSNYNNKLKNFSSDEILSKENDLRKIMTPLNANDNLDMLNAAGFKVVESFFQSLNFKGYICIK